MCDFCRIKFKDSPTYDEAREIEEAKQRHPSSKDANWMSNRIADIRATIDPLKDAEIDFHV